MTNAPINTARMLRQATHGLAEEVVGRLENGEAVTEPFAYSAGFAIRVEQVEAHLDTLAACIAFSSPAMLDDYIHHVATVSKLVPPHRDDIADVLSEIMGVIEEQFPQRAQAVIGEYLEHATHTLEEVPSPTPLATSDGSSASLQQQYLAALLATHRSEALQLILDAVQTGTSVESIYSQVLQPTLQQLGDLWQAGTISVAQEHYCTAAIEVLLARMQPYFFSQQNSPKSSEKTLVAACVGHELHQVGLRMVADSFESHGWKTLYLGANTPTESIGKAVQATEADVLAVSTTLTRNLFALTDVVSLLRSLPDCEHVKLLVGGRPFHTDPTLWKRIGADATAANAKEAVGVTERMLDLPANRLKP
ncbi:cobalamin B12-binding domain-containing protein [Roseimaritima ulvae]|uniref:Methylaspartate mutase subunit S n=1 Tax=Roseimaritima ulvae TaxID=980254 RepID=A0A5B9QVX2_9BACT|nr:cobalamin-dependent protein [Roseimaritima ulvae]QEG38083.1 methylaspartate mutase subunit S [Roseimaritima ulvae]